MSSAKSDIAGTLLKQVSEWLVVENISAVASESNSTRMSAGQMERANRAYEKNRGGASHKQLRKAGH